MLLSCNFRRSTEDNNKYLRQNSRCHGQYLNSGPFKYEADVLTTRPWSSVFSRTCGSKCKQTCENTHRAIFLCTLITLFTLEQEGVATFPHSCTQISGWRVTWRTDYSNQTVLFGLRRQYFAETYRIHVIFYTEKRAGTFLTYVGK
jgi:hypothetical protein